MSNRFLLFLLTLVVAVNGWQFYQAAEREQQLTEKIRGLTTQVNELQQRLAALETETQKLHDDSLGETVRRANGALLDAWQDLLHKLDEQVDEVREHFEQNYPDRDATSEEDALKRT